MSDTIETFVIPRANFPCFITSNGVVVSLKDVVPGVWVRENPVNGNIEVLHPENINYQKFDVIRKIFKEKE